MRLLPILCGAMLAAGLHTASAQDTGHLTSRQAAEDAAVLVRALRTLHPALDKYQTREQALAHFARFEQGAAAATDAGAMYLAATRLAASIRCGHTWTDVQNQSGAARARLLEAADKLPLTLELVEQRLLVLASAVPGIAPGDELMGVDGFTPAAMQAELLPYLHADGASDGTRLLQLSHRRAGYSMLDIVWPLLHPPAGGMYQLSVRSARGEAAAISVDAVTLARRKAALAAQGAKAPSEAWSMRYEADHAVMTLPTFSFNRDRFDWRAFYREAFAELDRRKTAALVVDIRANEGGDGAIGLALLSYLLREETSYISDQSVTTYERVPYPLVRYLDTWDYSFFDRTGQVEAIKTGPQAGRLSYRPAARKVHTLLPEPQRFKGKVYLLTGPENGAAAFTLAALAKKTGAAVLVGQPTGGNQRGINGGQLMWVTLPHSGVAVDIPLLAATYAADTPDAPIAPDIAVPARFEDARSGRDAAMAAALAAARGAL
jgi:C-terminal processing protease CtpA/Prc